MNNGISTEKVINLIRQVILTKKFETVAVHEPDFINTNALNYVTDCIETGWVSTAGSWVNNFEEAICNYTGAKYAIAVSNGTVALRLALFLIGVESNEEVIIPPMTFVATANSVSHLGAIPHFVDIDNNDLGLCPISLEKRLENIAIKKDRGTFNKETGRRISAIIPVHIFGRPCQVIEIKKIADHWGIPLVEDAAEALGSWIIRKGTNKHCGLFGKVSTISFNGNKVITTGGGGVLLTNDSKLAKRAKHLSNTAKIPHKWELEHDFIAWNDRLPNINAALGVAQMEVLKSRLVLKQKLFERYQEVFSKVQHLEILHDPKGSKSNHWLIALRIKDVKKRYLKKIRDNILNEGNENGLLLRPSWKLLNQLKMYRNCPSSDLKNAQDQKFRIINLPSSPQLVK